MRETLRHGERRRREILDAAIDLGSAEGLAGLSIGRLAGATGMSKSGLFAHFGSKAELQLAAIDAAVERFEQDVLSPTLEVDPGLARLRGMLERWIAHVEGSDYRGGCFFYATSSEFGSQPGPVRDRLADVTGRWLRGLEREARAAVRQRELRAGTDPARLAFRLHAYVQEANWACQLLDDARAFDHARAAIEETLRDARPRKGPKR